MPRNKRRAPRKAVADITATTSTTATPKEEPVADLTGLARFGESASDMSGSGSSSDSDSESNSPLESSTSSTVPKPLFIPARTFQGPKEGYVFKMDDDGLGYYVDEASATEKSATQTGAINGNERQKDAKGVKDKRFALPSRNEMQQLRQAEIVAKNNMYDLEVKELLKKGSLNYDSLKELESCLFTLKKTLDNLPDQEVDKACASMKACPGLGCLRQEHTKPITLSFVKPCRMDLVGSYLLHSIVKPQCNVDISIEMPEECFVAKDIADYRYHDKRRLYLSVVAFALMKEVPKHFSYVKVRGFREGNDRDDKPILVLGIASKDKRVKQFEIRLFPSLAEDEVFDVRKLGPSKGNLRGHRIANAKTSVQERRASPRYNCSVLEDMYMRYHLQFIHSAASYCGGLVEACQLLKVWLGRRGMRQAPDSFHGFLTSLLAAHLVNTRHINRSATAKQIFLKVLTFVTKHNFSTDGLVLCDSTGTEANVEIDTLMAHHLHVHDVVVLDPSGHLNVASRVSIDAYNEFRHQAELTIAFLKKDHGSTANSFDPLFLGTDLNFWRRYDQYIVVSPPGNCKRFWTQETLQNMNDYVQKALGDRAKFVRVVWAERDTHLWDVGSPAPNAEDRSAVVALSLNPETFARTLDRGPAADDKIEASKFRQFWGSKSELRRFQDGAIIEAVLWKCKSGKEHNIVGDIVRYALSRHMPDDVGASPEDVRIRVLSDQVDRLLEPRHSARNNSLSSDAMFKRLRQTLDKLSIAAQGLETLPLRITALHFSGPGGRFTHEHPPTLHTLLGGIEPGRNETGQASSIISPHPVLMTVESSGRWPDDLGAIKKVKTAFLCQLGKALRKIEIKSVANREHLDVLYEGYAFRLRLVCDRERELLEIGSSVVPVIVAGRRKLIYENAVHIDQKEATARLRSLRIRDDISLLHTSLIHNLNTSNLIFGKVARLAKLWLHAKMLSDVFPMEVVELMVASLFVDPSCRPHEPPASAISGFVRFLNLLATFEWDYEPLIVDLNGSITDPEVLQVEKVFEAQQQLTGGGKTNTNSTTACFVVAPYDRAQQWSPSWLENGRINMVGMKRAIGLAQEACVLDQHIVSAKFWRKMFSSCPLSEYDAVIHLFPEAMSCEYPALTLSKDEVGKKRKGDVRTEGNSGEQPKGKMFRIRTYKNLLAKDIHDTLLFGFDPFSEYINLLKKNFGHLAMFFRNSLSGSCIGILWNAAAFQPAPFKVSASRFAIPSHQFKLDSGESFDDTIVPNQNELVGEMLLLGKGFAERLEHM